MWGCIVSYLIQNGSYIVIALQLAPFPYWTSLFLWKNTIYINGLPDIFDLKSVILFILIRLLCFLFFCYVISSFFFFPPFLLPLSFLLLPLFPTPVFSCEVFIPSILLMAREVYSLFLILEVITLITLTSIHKHLDLSVLFHIQSTYSPPRKDIEIGACIHPRILSLPLLLA